MTHKNTYSLPRIFMVLFLAFMSWAMYTTVQTPAAGALTKKEKQACFDKYNKTGTGTAVSDDTPRYNYNKYMKSGCDRSDGGSCKLTRYNDGSSIRCVDPSTGEMDTSPTGPTQKITDVGKAPEESRCTGGANCCNGVKTTVAFGCPSGGSGVAGNPIFSLLIAIMNFLAIGVGVAVTGGIIYGAYRYITANGNAAQIQEGIKIIYNALIGLALFGFLYAIINFLVPGGAFR